MNIGFNRPNGLEILKMGVLNDDGRRLDGYTIAQLVSLTAQVSLKYQSFSFESYHFQFLTVIRNNRINSQGVMMWFLLCHSLNFHI